MVLMFLFLYLGFEMDVRCATHQLYQCTTFFYTYFSLFTLYIFSEDACRKRLGQNLQMNCDVLEQQHKNN